MMLFYSFRLTEYIFMGEKVADSNKGPRVLDCRASDNKYLHKNFHGALCYAVKYLDENYGPEATTEYLEQVGRTCFSPLTEQLSKEGLPALEKHWRDIFAKEDGEFSVHYESQTLVLTVDECPAITHLEKTNQLVTDRYCETTVVVNETICREAGYRCFCEYEPGKGKCIQKFWKDKE